GGGTNGARRAEGQIRPVTWKEGVRAEREENVEVACQPPTHARLALAGKSDAGAVLDAGRDVDRERALARDAPGTRAGRAGVVDDLAAALAAGAGALKREEALRMPDAAGAAAMRAGLPAGPSRG